MIGAVEVGGRGAGIGTTASAGPVGAAARRVRPGADDVAAGVGVEDDGGAFGCHRIRRDVELARTIRPRFWASANVICWPVAREHLCLLWWHWSHVLCVPTARVQSVLRDAHSAHFGCDGGQSARTKGVYGLTWE